MKRKHGPKAGGQRPHRQDGARHSSPAGFKARNRYRGSAGPGQYGPQACPMCGAVVGNLRVHIETKHDDTKSHPCE